MFEYRSAADKVMQARGDNDLIAREMIDSRRIGSSKLQTVAGAVAYLLLVLHQMGLGACWMAGPLQAKREIEAILEMSPEQQFVALVPVGWPAEAPAPRPHKPLEQMVRIL
jgi:nitroreductase